MMLVGSHPRIGPTYRCIGRVGVDIDIIKGDIVSPNQEVSPAWTVQLSNAFHGDASCVICQGQNWTVESVVGVENLASRKCIIPNMNQ